MAQRHNNEWFPNDVDAHICIEAGIWAGANDIPPETWPKEIDSSIIQWLIDTTLSEV